MISKKQIVETQKRFEDRAADRHATQARIRNGATPLTVDTPERVGKYLARQGLPGVAAALPSLRDTAAPPLVEPARLPQTERLLYERVLGTSQLMAVRFLERGANLARAVGRVRIQNGGGRTLGYGTGTLISPRLMLTNHHVLEDAELARSSWFELNYLESSPGKLVAPTPFELEPDAFFEISPALDFAVVAVRSTAKDGTALSNFGYARLLEEEGKVLLGQTLNIIQHPGGEPKQVALRENKLVDILEFFLHYETDTAPGSSGSLVCSDEWEVVALHHSGVPETDDQGNYLAVDGSHWVNAMGEHRLKWKANEGVRVSRILKDLKARPLTPQKRALLNEVFASPPLGNGFGHSEKGALAGAATALAVRPAAPADRPEVLQISISVPLTAVRDVSRVSVGGMAVSPAVGLAPRAVALTPVATDLDQALAELAEAKTQPYYSAAQDQAEAAEYYADIDTGADHNGLYRALHELLAETHVNEIRYAPARHVYPWVDLHPDLLLRSIYSGQEFEPEEVIREDFRILEQRIARAEAVLRTREGAFTESEFLREVELLEATYPYNCEHVVPQSWFGKKEPMRGDLHHLFTCESGCNSFRGNTPYYDFPDFEEAVRDECGKREENKFEPGSGKGAVARASLYFLLRYPGEINDRASEYTPDRIAILVRWHRDNPVTRWERHRNAVIFRKQGNRNPLIDKPEWEERIEFSNGLG